MAKRVKPGELNEELIIQSFKLTNHEMNPSEVVCNTSDEPPREDDAEAESAKGAACADDTANQKGKPRRRKGNYDEIYLRRKEIKSRQPVYISQQIHQSITRLVHLLALANKEISVGGYIDNVLAEHLERHKDEIAELYRSQMNEFL